MLLFPGIFSNEVKVFGFFFPHCLSSEILLEVQEALHLKGGPRSPQAWGAWV